MLLNYKQVFYTVIAIGATIISSSSAFAANPPTTPRLPCAPMSEGQSELILFTDSGGQSRYEKVVCSRVATSAANPTVPIDRKGNVINEGGQPNKYDQYVKASGADVTAGNYTWRYMLESNFSANSAVPGVNNLTSFISCQDITNVGANTVTPPANARWARFWIVGAGGGGAGATGNPYASCALTCYPGSAGEATSVVFFSDSTPSHAISINARGGGGGACYAAGANYSNNGYAGYGTGGSGNSYTCSYIRWCGWFNKCGVGVTISSRRGGNGEVKYYEAFITGGVPFTINIGAGGTGGVGHVSGGNGANGLVHICWYK